MSGIVRKGKRNEADYVTHKAWTAFMRQSTLKALIIR